MTGLLHRVAAIILLFVAISTYALETEDDDSVTIEATFEPSEVRKVLRESRQLFGSTRGLCLTSKGEIGKCTTFKECYPYFKIPDLGALDGWVLGVYDTCSYIQSDGHMGFGICCSNLPITTPSDPTSTTSSPTIDDTNDYAEPDKKRPQGTWPPPLPTHPPYHTIPPLPTHPSSSSAASSSTQQDPVSLTTVTTSKRPGTTWPTKKPTWWPGATTGIASIVPVKPPFTTIPPSIASSSCGAKNGNQEIDSSKIVGGHRTEPGEWPWIAALFNGGRQVCGGSLIDDRHILSAAHCVAHMNSWDVARLTVRLGDYNIRTSNEVKHVERRVKRVVRHRGFDSITLYNDVAILTLNEPVPFSEQIRPICLPSGSKLYNGKSATVIGWGSIRESGPQPAELQEVTIPIWSNNECKIKYGSAAPGGIVDSFLCAGRATKDSCSGDSGGPLMVNDGRWTQVGIVSWGIGCGKGQYPGVYTRVTHFLPWIYKNLK